MDYFLQPVPSPSVEVGLSRFAGQSGADEYHLTLQPTEYGSLETQLRQLREAYEETLASLGLDTGSAVLRRFFLSDLVNQSAVLEAHTFSDPCGSGESCAVSWICQPPPAPAKVALWAYHVHSPEGSAGRSREGASFIREYGGLAHCWSTGLTFPEAGGSYDQTRRILERYDDFLQERGMTFADNVLRTWFFVQNIDADYGGLVKARREFFTEKGLTADTHFVASTGIGGTHADLSARVTLDSLAVSGLRPEQIRFLTAPDHLSPTHIYGVTFERGTAVSYSDRRQVMLSGTASIDSQGCIVHPGDVLLQTDRMLENMEALLAAAGAGLQDMGFFLVYLRDMSDCAAVRQRMRRRCPEVPLLIVHAPICRPGWLVEAEGVAVVPDACPELPSF